MPRKSLTSSTTTPHDGAEMLAALRKEMARQKLDAFIVPHADNHQNEYLPANAERLARLSGFTGSAGTAVVFAKHAALFVDGRYTLQARMEADVNLFECLDLNDKPWNWVSAQIKSGNRVGFDPTLHTPRQIASLRRAIEQSDGELVACDTNPFDVVWHDRPDAPTDIAVPFDTQFAGKDSAEKRTEIAQHLREHHLDACVLSALDSIAWLFNIRGNDLPFTPMTLAFAILYPNSHAEIFIDSRKVTDALRQHLGPNVKLYDPNTFADALQRLGRNKNTVRIDTSTASVWIAATLEASGASIRPGTDPCQLAKAQKNPTEVSGMRNAHERDGVALSRFLAWLDKSDAGTISEIDAADKLDRFRSENELFQGLSFPTISGSGPNGAIVHYRVSNKTNRLLGDGELYLVDSGGHYLDGTTDVTRTIAIGTPNKAMCEHYTRVLKGHIALSSAIFPEGTTGSQLDALARRPLWDVGMDYNHGTGHGVGSFLSVHEGPQRISKINSTIPLMVGMVLSIEPGYYQENAYGIRIENLVTVVETSMTDQNNKRYFGFEPLTLAPFDLRLVMPQLLGADERDWLNSYHARVKETLSPRLPTDVQKWLSQATRELPQDNT